jgi:hypothetical protein
MSKLSDISRLFSSYRAFPRKRVGPKRENQKLDNGRKGLHIENLLGVDEYERWAIINKKREDKTSRRNCYKLLDIMPAHYRACYVCNGGSITIIVASYELMRD